MELEISQSLPLYRDSDTEKEWLVAVVDLSVCELDYFYRRDRIVVALFEETMLARHFIEAAEAARDVMHRLGEEYERNDDIDFEDEISQARDRFFEDRPAWSNGSISGWDHGIEESRF